MWQHKDILEDIGVYNILAARGDKATIQQMIYKKLLKDELSDHYLSYKNQPHSSSPIQKETLKQLENWDKQVKAIDLLSGKPEKTE